MATTADYLNKLVEQKNTLADNLVTKGVSATHSETLETLVPKVLNISGGGGETTGYISDGLISFSELNDTLTCNLITDKMLGRDVNYCDGTNGYFKVSNPNTTSQMSAEFTLQVLIRTITSDAQMFGVIYDSPFRSAVFCINDGYFGLERASSHISTEILINDNEWHMLTAAYDGAIMRLYVDGASILEYEHTWDIPSNAVICIGQWQTGSSKYIGYIANACIYNRALSGSEILQNWQTDVERYGISETKTYWYKNGIFDKSEFDIANSDNWIFVSNTNQSKSISINENNQIEIVMAQKAAASCSILINSMPIDVTDIKQVIFNISFSMTNNSDSESRGTAIAFAISDTNNIGIVSGEWSPETALTNFEKSEYIQNPNNTTGYTGSSHIILDVSDISGERYFYFTHIKPQPEVGTNSDIIKINSIYVV